MRQYTSPTRDSRSEYGENSTRQGQIASKSPQREGPPCRAPVDPRNSVAPPQPTRARLKPEPQGCGADPVAPTGAGVCKTACGPNDTEREGRPLPASTPHPAMPDTEEATTTLVAVGRTTTPFRDLSRVGHHHYQTMSSDPQGGQ